MKIKKVFQVAERGFWKIIAKVNGELYKEKYPKYLRKIGINIPEDYRGVGGYGFIDPTAHFDGNDYSLISIGKETTISANVILLTHDYSIRVGMKSIGIENPKGRFLKPITIGDRCFIGMRSLILPGAVIGDNCIIGAGSVVSGEIPSNSVAAGVPCKVVCGIREWTKRHITKGDIVEEDEEILRALNNQLSVE